MLKVSRLLATSLEILVANTQFSIALATSWSQFRTLKWEMLPTHFQSCSVIQGNKILMPDSKSTLGYPAPDMKWTWSCNTQFLALHKLFDKPTREEQQLTKD